MKVLVCLQNNYSFEWPYSVFLEVCAWLSLGLQWLWWFHQSFPFRLDGNVKLVKFTKKTYCVIVVVGKIFHHMEIDKNVIGQKRRCLLAMFSFIDFPPHLHESCMTKSAILGSKFRPVCELCSLTIHSAFQSLTTTKLFLCRAINWFFVKILHWWLESTFFQLG